MISGIALTAHSQRGRSCSRVCVTWSPTLPHPVLHIPFMLGCRGNRTDEVQTGCRGNRTDEVQTLQCTYQKDKVSTYLR